MDEWHILNIRLQMEALISEREGMIAENQHRLSVGQSVAYGEDSFMLNAKQFTNLLCSLRSL
jgi:hypothetical protein